MKGRKGFLYGIGVILLLGISAFTVQSKEGGFSFLGKAIMWGAGAAVIIVAAVVVLVIVLAICSSDRKGSSTPQNIAVGGGSTSARKKAALNLSQEDNDIIADANQEFLQLRQAVLRVKNNHVREKSNRVCEQTSKILTTLKNKADTLTKARQFLNYYLPTMKKVIEKYTQMEQNGIADEAMTNKVLEYLNDAYTVTEKQYHSLFETDILDLTVEMDVMTAFCKKEGLLTDQEMTF